MQQSIGNQAVCAAISRTAGPPNTVRRTVTIQSYNVGKGGPDNAELDVRAIQAALRSRFNGATQQTLVTNLQTANTQNWAGADVNALARQLCVGVANPAPVDAVAEAIGSTLVIGGAAAIHGTNRDEAPQFDLAAGAATSMSRTKGTANQVNVQTLDGVLSNSGIAGIVRDIRALDNKLKVKQNDLKESWPETWPPALAGDELNVREAHGNNAGWLPVVDVRASYNAQQQRIDNRIAQPAMQQWISEAGKNRSEVLARFNLITSDHFFPDQDDRRKYIWAAYCEGVSPYIEFAVPGKKDQRVVFDFVNKEYYFTVHYKWYRGYNPFFKLTGV